MTDQMSLLYPREAIQVAFETVHAAHPEVYDALVRRCRQVKARGWSKIGIAFVFENARWDLTVARDLTEPFKLNNNYRSRYARLIMDQEPDLQGLFDLRQLVAA